MHNQWTPPGTPNARSITDAAAGDEDDALATLTTLTEGNGEKRQETVRRGCFTPGVESHHMTDAILSVSCNARDWGVLLATKRTSLMSGELHDTGIVRIRRTIWLFPQAVHNNCLWSRPLTSLRLSLSLAATTESQRTDSWYLRQKEGQRFPHTQTLYQSVC